MSWLGRLVGAVVAAPARIINIPVKVLEASVGEKAKANVLDDVAAAAEQAGKKVIDGEETEA